MKKKNVIFSFTFILFVLLLSRCTLPDTAYDLFLENNTNQYLHYYLAFGDNIISTTVYPDTLLPDNNSFINNIVKPQEKYFMYLSFLPYSKIIKNLPQDTLSVFIFSKDTIDKFGWSEVLFGYKILQRYDISSEDIKKLKDIIPYPPSEKMKDMKMYPAYGEDK